MDYRKFGSKLLIRLAPGEELVASLTEICKKEQIALASVSGIGAVNRVTVGLFRTKEKKYISDELRDDFEITALAGNVSTMNGETYLHLHITVANAEHKTFGGHLNEAHVSATAEIVLDILDGEIDRFHSDEIGLNLLKFD